MYRSSPSIVNIHFHDLGPNFDPTAKLKRIVSFFAISGTPNSDYTDTGLHNIFNMLAIFDTCDECIEPFLHALHLQVHLFFKPVQCATQSEIAA